MAQNWISYLLGLVALILAIVAFFIHGDPKTVQAVEDFSTSYQAILTSIGTLVLVGLLTFITTHISIRSASRREVANRRIAAELKIAEFRQTWINNLRDALADFHSYGTIPNGNPKLEREFYKLGTKIELLMNPEDPDFEELQRYLYGYLDASDKGTMEKYRLNPDFVDLCQRILKREWERLKKELRGSSIEVSPK